MLNLGDLEFKAEDFDDLVRSKYDLAYDPQNGRAAIIANRILREKLEKAPKIGHYCREWRIGKHWVQYLCHHSQGKALWSTCKTRDTHTARLVCIEPCK